MTLDDFKKHFELFSKIDTPEKLAICESQYEKHLLHIEDEAYFEPAKNDTKDGLASEYEKKLNDIFLLDKIKVNQFYFFVMPSLGPENLLILEQQENGYVLTYTALTQSYWASFYAGNKSTAVQKTIVTSGLNKAVGEQLFLLLDKAISESRAPKAGNLILDGIIYKLSKLLDGGPKIVFKHSPEETSRSGQIIKIMEQLIDNIDHLDEVIQLNIKTKIIAIRD